MHLAEKQKRYLGKCRKG